MEFMDAFGVHKLQQKDFPALEGGTPKAGWVKGACPPLKRHPYGCARGRARSAAGFDRLSSAGAAGGWAEGSMQAGLAGIPYLSPHKLRHGHAV